MSYYDPYLPSVWKINLSREEEGGRRMALGWDVVWGEIFTPFARGERSKGMRITGCRSYLRPKRGPYQRRKREVLERSLNNNNREVNSPQVLILRRTFGGSRSRGASSLIPGGGKNPSTRRAERGFRGRSRKPSGKKPMAAFFSQGGGRFMMPKGIGGVLEENLPP